MQISLQSASSLSPSEAFIFSDLTEKNDGPEAAWLKWPAVSSVKTIR